MHRNRVWRVLSSGIVAIAAACNPRPASVKPGINDGFKNIDDIAEWVDRFEGESREVFRARDGIVRAADIRPGMTVADIGAGTGLFVAPFARQVGSSGHVFAVDIAPEFLEHIEARVREAGLTRVKTVLARDDSVELPDASIDLAFTCDTYHHFEYPIPTLRSIHRALRPGGRLIIVDFDRIEGVSREWILDHVRAGKAQVIEEITGAGFEFVEEIGDIEELKENYMLVFRRSGT